MKIQINSDSNGNTQKQTLKPGESGVQIIVGNKYLHLVKTLVIVGIVAALYAFLCWTKK